MVATIPNDMKSDTISNPPQMMQKYNSVTFCADVMHVNKILFHLHITGFEVCNRKNGCQQ